MRSERSLHSSHTDSGTTPAFINRAKTLQPRQIPKADSKKAAPASMTTTTRAAPGAPDSQSRDPLMENTTPMACANRFGGPGVNRGAPRRRRSHFGREPPEWD